MIVHVSHHDSGGFTTDPISSVTIPLSHIFSNKTIHHCYYIIHGITHTQRMNMWKFPIHYYSWKPWKPLVREGMSCHDHRTVHVADVGGMWRGGTPHTRIILAPRGLSGVCVCCCVECRVSCVVCRVWCDWMC